ncbi:MAG: GDP-L-fucose synthase [Betaproteobacteria bacterium]|nr:GDP-L-fucose synthase [Betaproteobacteria bacterium]
MSELTHKSAKIYIAGHRGLAGSAIVRKLEAEGYTNLLTRTHAELDLTDQRATREFFEREKPEYVFLAAAKVGGILANDTCPAEFIHQNLAIQTNVIHESWKSGVKRLIFLGSSCIYPRDCPQPIREEYLLTGPLEKTNQAYALAKIAGIEMCGSYNQQYGTQFLCAMPTNLYGPGDNYDLSTSHVLPALIRKAHEAKLAGADSMTVWGSGTPRREFLFSGDLAAALLVLVTTPWDAVQKALPSNRLPLINVGCGEDMTIRELAETVCEVVGFKGELKWDASKPDGTPRKLLDTSRIFALGWRPQIELEAGIASAHQEHLSRASSQQKVAA